MPRIRTIKPQFWLDEALGKLPRDARLLYIGLWNLCDDYGVFEYRPPRIKVQLFPYDADISGNDIKKWLDLLTAAGNIIPFTSEGDDYGYIPSFLKHQLINNPSKWRFAEPPDDILRKITTPALPQSYRSPTPALPLRKRKRKKEKEKEKGKGKGVGVTTNHNSDQTRKTNQYVAALARNYRAEIGTVSPTINRELADFAQSYAANNAPIRWIDEAFAEAARNNKRNWAYVRAILNAWIEKGKAGKPQREEQVEREWREKQERALQERVSGNLRSSHE